MADILIVDDEENLSYSIQVALQRAGHECRICDTTAGALEACGKQLPSLALVDIQLPDANGLDLMKEFQDRGWDIPTIIITAYGTVDRAVAAMKQGAVDFIQKPLVLEEVALAVDRCLENRQIRYQLDAYREAQQRESGAIQLIGECPAMQEVVRLADKIAAIPADSGNELTTILLLGETGTGKEVVARYIHHRNPHLHRPLVQVNCTAIPENLFEAELFGHERGTFTDAKTAKKGLLETAHEGTLLLDEIGDMPLSAQAKLLVAIESRRFRRLGGTTERLARVQVMAAANVDLQQKVEQGEFRADLFYRLKVFCIELPPLRTRGADLFLLANYFTEMYCQKFRKPVMHLSPEAREVMEAYSWPGNVRELANVLQRAVLVTEGDVLDADVLGIDPRRTGQAIQATGVDLGERLDGSQTLASMEREIIEAALRKTDGNVSDAARLLGMTRGALRHRLEKLGL